MAIFKEAEVHLASKSNVYKSQDAKMYFVEITADRLTTNDVNQCYFSTWPKILKYYKILYSVIGV